jgi:hypothetical protein
MRRTESILLIEFHAHQFQRLSALVNTVRRLVHSKRHRVLRSAGIAGSRVHRILGNISFRGLGRRPCDASK